MFGAVFLPPKIDLGFKANVLARSNPQIEKEGALWTQSNPLSEVGS